VRLAAAVLALVCCLLVIRFDSRVDRAVAQVIHPPPWSITWLVTVVYQVGSYGVAIALVLLAVVARRWEIARDIGLSAAGTAAVTGILILLLGSNGGRPAGIVIDDYVLRFPVLQVALFMALTTAALPYLARGVQRLIEVFIALVALACGGRPRAAAECAGEPGHRLGYNSGGPAGLRLAARPAFRR